MSDFKPEFFYFYRQINWLYNVVTSSPAERENVDRKWLRMWEDLQNLTQTDLPLAPQALADLPTAFPKNTHTNGYHEMLQESDCAQQYLSMHFEQLWLEELDTHKTFPKPRSWFLPANSAHIPAGLRYASNLFRGKRGCMDASKTNTCWNCTTDGTFIIYLLAFI